MQHFANEQHVVAVALGAQAAALEHRQRTGQHRRAVARPGSSGRLRIAWRPTPADAKRRDSSTCCSVSTLIAKCSAAWKAARLGLSWRSDHCTSGGSSESAPNELTVRPTGAPLASVQVASVTPVAKRPSAERSAAVSAPPSNGPRVMRATARAAATPRAAHASAPSTWTALCASASAQWPRCEQHQRLGGERREGGEAAEQAGQHEQVQACRTACAATTPRPRRPASRRAG